MHTLLYGLFLVSCCMFHSTHDNTKSSDPPLIFYTVYISGDLGQCGWAVVIWLFCSLVDWCAPVWPQFTPVKPCSHLADCALYEMNGIWQMHMHQQIWHVSISWRPTHARGCSCPCCEPQQAPLHSAAVSDQKVLASVFLNFKKVRKTAVKMGCYTDHWHRENLPTHPSQRSSAWSDAALIAILHYSAQSIHVHFVCTEMSKGSGGPIDGPPVIDISVRSAALINLSRVKHSVIESTGNAESR